MLTPKELFIEYCQFVPTTCVQSSWEALYYGLCEEWGELGGIYKRAYRGDANSDLNNEEIKTKIKKELGDIFWYLVAINHYYGSPNLELSSFIFQENTYPYLAQTLVNLDNTKISKQIKELINMALINLCSLIHYHDFSVKEILITNMNKLRFRQQNNTIYGQGDDR